MNVHRGWAARVRQKLGSAIYKYRHEYTSRKVGPNIYHCCLHKTGSQWFRRLLGDRMVWEYSRYKLYIPGVNFTLRKPEDLEKLNDIPSGVIVSPLYIRYEDFDNIPKPKGSRAFFVIRDPRDIVVSAYFSMKFSHSVIDSFIAETREKLNAMTESEGIMEIIQNHTSVSVLEGWAHALQANKIRAFRFENVFGPATQRDSAQDLLSYCGIEISDNDLDKLLEKYSFGKFSGREPGHEDAHHHYRKGVAGDWKNHFTENHKAAFKNHAGEVLIKLGYEKGPDW